VACALAWVQRNATAEGLDPRSVTLAGQSAGATLALSTTSALVAGERACETPVPVPRAVVAFFPVVDMSMIAPSLSGRLLVVPYADHVFDHPFGSPGGQIARSALARFVQEYGRA